MITAVFSDGRQLRRELHAGSSYLSSEDPRCHFGLGTAVKAIELHVQWPNEQETILENVDANQIVVVPTLDR